MKELRAMKVEDLQKEVLAQRVTTVKLRLAVQINKEKDTSKYQKARKALARLETALTEKVSSKNENKGSSKSSKSSSIKKKKDSIVSAS